MFMEKINQLKTNKVYLPCTPSKWISEPETKPITEINLTSGGGMGGKSWTEYVERTVEFRPNTLQEFTRIDGKKIVINTSFITYIENFELVTVTYDTQNEYRNPGVHKEHFLKSDIPGDIVLVNSYGEN